MITVRFKRYAQFEVSVEILETDGLGRDALDVCEWVRKTMFPDVMIADDPIVLTTAEKLFRPVKRKRKRKP